MQQCFKLFGSLGNSSHICELVAMLMELGTKNTCPKKEIRLDCCRKSDNNGENCDKRKSKKSKEGKK